MLEALCFIIFPLWGHQGTSTAQMGFVSVLWLLRGEVCSKPTVSTWSPGEDSLLIRRVNEDRRRSLGGMKTDRELWLPEALTVTLIPCPSAGSDIKATEVPWASPGRTFLRDTSPGPALSPLRVWLTHLHGSLLLMLKDACLSFWRGLQPLAVLIPIGK